MSPSPVTPRASAGHARFCCALFTCLRVVTCLPPAPRVRLLLKPPQLSTPEMATSFTRGPSSEPQSQELAFPSTAPSRHAAAPGARSRLVPGGAARGLWMRAASSQTRGAHGAAVSAHPTSSVRSVGRTSCPGSTRLTSGPGSAGRMSHPGPAQRKSRPGSARRSTSRPGPAPRKSSCSLDLVHSPGGHPILRPSHS